VLQAAYSGESTVKMTKNDGDASLPPVRHEVRGFILYPGLIAPDDQVALVAALREVVAAAPLMRPVTPGGRDMSVRMTAAGRLGWVTDRRGYRSEPKHPSGVAWPAIPDRVLDVWRAVAGTTRDPDCCLINFYGLGARMGLHQDKDEGDFSYPVVSISLGDEALFRMGGVNRAEGTQSLWLRSGDVVVMGGAARLAWHGIDRVRHGSSGLLPQGGRINLTLRVVAEGG
jgi:alkylated DNA repair protein (DNA oxidative demethylase)